MIFPAVEYDAGASLHLKKCTSIPAHQRAFQRGRGINPPIFKFEI
jgi:hypothetical protein